MQFSRKSYQEKIKGTSESIPHDEPVFLLRAQDRLAKQNIKVYLRQLEDAGLSDQPIATSVRNHLKLMEAWEKTHAVKTPDVDESDLVEILESEPGVTTNEGALDSKS